MDDDAYKPDGRTHRERMLAGDQYIADDSELARESLHAEQLTAAYNATTREEREQRERLLARLLGAIGEGTMLRPPIRFDYGYQTSIGNRTFANWGLVVADVARVTIGDDVQIGPNVQLLTATHPVDPEPRRAKWESGEPISIGDNVWLGGGVIVCPGVSIGENTVVGAGAVVVRNLPANVLAVGNPATAIRKL